MSVLKRISSFIVQKLLPIKYKVWLLETLACDIAAQGEDGDTELAHINSYEAKLLKSVGGSGTINSKTGLKMYGSGGGSAPSAPATSTTVTKEEFPPELRPYITDILSKAQAQEEARQDVGYPVYPGPRIAPFTTEEQAAQEGIRGQVGATQPGYDIAKGLTAAGTGAATASDISSGMSPYMQNVVDIEKREAQRAAEPMQQKIAAEAIGAQGSFGGSRQAILEAEANRNLQQQLGDIQTRGQQAAFQESQRAFEAQKARQLAGGQQFAGLTSTQQGSAMKELGALAGVGEQQRQQTQKALDLGFQQFREEQTYPEASLQQYQSIIRGFPISPTTTQTQQSLLPTPSLSQQLIGGAAATAGLGMAGAIPKLFAEGGSTFPDLSGDGKVTQKDILMGKGVIKKKGGKKISKKDNKALKALYALIASPEENEERESNKDLAELAAEKMMEYASNNKGLNTIQAANGGVVKMSEGSSGLMDIIKNVGTQFGYEPGPKPFSYGDVDYNLSSENLRRKAKLVYGPDGKPSHYVNKDTGKIISKNLVTGEEVSTSNVIPNTLFQSKSDEPSAISEGFENFTDRAGDVVNKYIANPIKGIGNILGDAVDVGTSSFKPGGQEEYKESVKQFVQNINEKPGKLKDFAGRVVDKGKRIYKDIETRIAKQQPGSFLQKEGLIETLKSTKRDVDITNQQIASAENPEARKQLIKLRDRKIQEANTLATRYNSNINSYEDLIPMLENEILGTGESAEQKVKPQVTETAKTKTDGTKPDETKTTSVLGDNETKGAEDLIEEKFPVNPEDPNSKLLQEENKKLLNEPKTAEAMSVADKFTDFIKQQDKESKSDYEKRRGYAIAEMGFRIMGGERISDAAMSLTKNLSEMEKENAARKAKQFDRELQVAALSMEEDKTKRTLDIAEADSAINTEYKQAMIGAIGRKDLDTMTALELTQFVPSEIKLAGGQKFDLSGYETRIGLRAQQLMVQNKMGSHDAMQQAIADEISSSGITPDVGLLTKISSAMKSVFN